jgi:hypothetical protein
MIWGYRGSKPPGLPRAYTMAHCEQLRLNENLLRFTHTLCRLYSFDPQRRRDGRGLIKLKPGHRHQT